MTRTIAVVAAIAALIYGAVAGVKWLTPRMEKDISDRVTTSLAEKGLLWADVNVSGRTVELTGTAPSKDAEKEALTAAARVFGVALVSNGLVLEGTKEAKVAAKVEPKKVEKPVTKAKKIAGVYHLSVDKEGDKIVLTGAVPDEESHDKLRRIAQTHYGAENVVDKLEVYDGAPAGWTSAAGVLIFNIANLEKARAEISKTEVMVSGEALDKDFASQAEDQIKAALPNEFRVAFALDVVEPAAGKAEEKPATGVADVVEKAVTAVAKTVGSVGDTCGMVPELKREKVYFGFDKTDVSDAYKPVVERVSNVLIGCEKKHVLVAGYTDATGSKTYNKWLSQQRADAVMRAMMRAGVEKSRITSKGYGEKSPSASNKTRKGRALNRRVDFHPGDVAKPVAQQEVVKPVEKKSAKTLTIIELPAKAEAKSEDKTNGWWGGLEDAIRRAEDAVNKVQGVSATAK